MDISPELLQAIEQVLDSRLTKFQTELSSQMDALGKQLNDIQSTVRDLDSRVERQDRRLAAIENFPLPPMKQPSRLYATETHSVSLPQRVRLGYAG